MLEGSYRIIEKDGLFFCQSLTRQLFSFKRKWEIVKNKYGYATEELASKDMEKYINWNEPVAIEYMQC